MGIIGYDTAIFQSYFGYFGRGIWAVLFNLNEVSAKSKIIAFCADLFCRFLNGTLLFRA